MTTVKKPRLRSQQELESLISRYGDAYYGGEAEVSDAVYDRLRDELARRFPDSAVLQSVGSPLSGADFKHDVFMGSLEKVRTIDEVNAWLHRYKVAGKLLYLSHKVDGGALSLHYKNGNLIAAATRGDGVVGKSVLGNARMINDLPAKLPTKFTGEVRGEVYMPREIFRYLVECENLPLANPRNAANGALQAKDPELVKARGLRFVAYSVFGLDSVSEGDCMTTLESWNFKTPPCQYADDSTFMSAIWTMEAERAELPYDTDGIVISIDSVPVQDEMGHGTRCPNFRVAWKYETEKAETTIRDIVWQVGRTGKVTPVAEVDPVHLAGTTVTRVTLSSFRRCCEELRLSVGSTILIEKAGEIIPNVVDVLKRSGVDESRPTLCPSCGSLLSVEGAHLFCQYSACPGQVVNKIAQWFTTIGVKGIGLKAIEQLHNAEIINTIADVYSVCAHDLVDQLEFGKVQAANFIKARDAVREVPLATFLDALGIPTLGTVAARDLAARYKCAANFGSAALRGQLEGVGEVAAKTIFEWWVNNVDKVEAILDYVVPVSVEAEGDALAGKSFCVTGTLTRPRNDIHKLIEAQGGAVRSSVSGKLDYLVVGLDAGSKEAKAKALGVTCISEDELLAMVAE